MRALLIIQKINSFNIIRNQITVVIVSSEGSLSFYICILVLISPRVIVSSKGSLSFSIESPGWINTEKIFGMKFLFL